MIPELNQSQTRKRKFRRGDIWYTDLGPQVKKGIQAGVRPSVICRSEKHFGETLFYVAPISSSMKGNYPFLQEIMLDRPSQIHYENMQPVTRDCFEDYICRLTKFQIMEMDIRMSITTGQDLCNFLHYNRIIVESTWFSNKINDRMYSGRIKMLFGEKKFRFSREEFYSAFPDYPNLLDSDFSIISEFFETLPGMKFLYNLIES